MSSTRRTDTPARYISISASSTELSRRRYRSMIAVSNALPAQLRNPQPYLTGLGLQAALVVAGAGIAARGAALIALRIAQPIRLRIEQGVQRLLHGAPHHPVEVALDPLVGNLTVSTAGKSAQERSEWDDRFMRRVWLRLSSSSRAGADRVFGYCDR